MCFPRRKRRERCVISSTTTIPIHSHAISNWLTNFYFIRSALPTHIKKKKIVDKKLSAKLSINKTKSLNFNFKFNSNLIYVGKTFDVYCCAMMGISGWCGYFLRDFDSSIDFLSSRFLMFWIYFLFFIVDLISSCLREITFNMTFLFVRREDMRKLKHGKLLLNSPRVKSLSLLLSCT